jgi:hypothetical protein
MCWNILVFISYLVFYVFFETKNILSVHTGYPNICVATIPLAMDALVSFFAPPVFILITAPVSSIIAVTDRKQPVIELRQLLCEQILFDTKSLATDNGVVAQSDVPFLSQTGVAIYSAVG